MNNTFSSCSSTRTCKLVWITDLPLEKLNIGVFDLLVHSFKKSIFVIIALVPFSLLPQCLLAMWEVLTKADWLGISPCTALLTRTEQIGRILEGQAKGNYCLILPNPFVSTNLSLLVIYFLKKVRVKWSESFAHSHYFLKSAFGKIEHMAKGCSL